MKTLTQIDPPVALDRLVRHSFRALGRDLYFDLKCTCPYRSNNTELAKILKHTIKLYGYADDNFFDRVNAESQEGVCECGRKYRVQWFRDGVEAIFLPNALGEARADSATSPQDKTL